MKSLIRKGRIFFSSFINHFKFIITERLFFINSIITPLGLSVLFYFIFFHHTRQQMVLGVVKAGLLGLWGANIWGASFILQGEKRLGTIDYLMVAPQSIYLVLAGKALAVALASNISILVSLFWVQIFVGPIWYFFNIAEILLIIFASTFAFSCVGLMVGLFFVNFRQPEVLIQFFTYPIYLLSGIAVSIEIFPTLVQVISKTIPLYWAQRGLFEILTKRENLTSIIFLFLIGVLFLIGTLFVIQRVERRARWTGDFSKY